MPCAVLIEHTGIDNSGYRCVGKHNKQPTWQWKRHNINTKCISLSYFFCLFMYRRIRTETSRVTTLFHQIFGGVGNKHRIKQEAQITNTIFYYRTNFGKAVCLRNMCSGMYMYKRKGVLDIPFWLYQMVNHFGSKWEVKPSMFLCPY